MALRVVLVDDDERFRAVARRALLEEGLDVVGEIARGADVAGAVAQWHPDVLLLDIGLPDIDGIDVARQLGPDRDGMRVILISTRDVGYGRRVAGGVADGYVPKDELSLAAILDVIGP